ncbi:MAG: TetR/AcrR family transcriptional regulator [bacterium]|nr:TetR/AcrR family transcriptional regulator [bacterium]
MAEPLDESSPPPEPTGTADTKTSLLDAAEHLFAHEGVDRASLRAITQAAGANLAAVHYHFGSKEALVREVLARRLSPLNERRIELLDRVEAESSEPKVEDIVRAFVQPTLEMVQRERGGHAFARFVCRTFSEPDETFHDIVLDQFRGIVTRFSSALARALPELPRDELFWRFHFMVGSMVHAAGLGSLAHRLSGGLCNPADLDGLTTKLVRFLSGGLQAEAAALGGGNET